MTTASPEPGSDVLVLDLRLRPLHLAEHVLDQGAPVDLADLVRPDALPVSQHRHAVAELEDLVEPVRDEDDAPALRDEVARRPEHALDLRLAERRGRLVEDEQARVADEEAGDLDELPLADRERLDRASRAARGEGRAGRERCARARRGAAAGRGAGTSSPPRKMLSSTLSSGTRLSSWFTSAIPCACASCGFRSESSSPSKRITPSSGLTSPTSAFTRVLLPAPLCPQIACTSPTRTSSERLAHGAHRAVRLREVDDLEEHAARPGSSEERTGSGRRPPDPVRRSSSEA